MNLSWSHPLWQCGLGPVSWLGAGAAEVTE